MRNGPTTRCAPQNSACARSFCLVQAAVGSLISSSLNFAKQIFVYFMSIGMFGLETVVIDECLILYTDVSIDTLIII